MSEPVKPWVRSIKYHTYWNSPRDPDTFYQVDTEQDADTLESLKMAVREEPPAKATRVTPAEPPPQTTDARPRRSAKVMTTGDLPQPKRDA